MQLAFTLYIHNVGYTSPYNERPMQLIMRNKNGKEFVFAIDTDIRKLYKGLHSLTVKIVTDALMNSGDYDLFLNLPDADQSLSNRFEYSIRFANENMWEGASGYNNLPERVTITGK